MMATTNAEKACSKEETETAYLDVISMDVELNIAIVGEIGSGRSSFVNAIRG
jgi:ABC-type lipoprotein export system ATPase subunit